jgi:hypothetical protein
MGEIKSTLDLVMEKTKHLTLSQKEKEEHKQIEVSKRLKGLLQKYQDNLLRKEQLGQELEGLRKTYDLNVNEMLSRIIIDGLKIGNNNKSLLELLSAICGLDVSGLEELFREFEKTIEMSTKKRTDEIMATLAKKHFISGSAVVPNLENDSGWLAKTQEIKSKFDQILSREKDAMTTGL